VGDEGENHGGFLRARVRDTFELNQLRAAPSQLLPVFLGFDRFNLIVINLDWSISCIFFQVPAYFFFIVMTTGHELGH
jgi:hypothetical protein